MIRIVTKMVGWCVLGGLALSFTACETAPTRAEQAMVFRQRPQTPDEETRYNLHYYFGHILLPGMAYEDPASFDHALSSAGVVFLRRIWYDFEDKAPDFVNAGVDEIELHKTELADGRAIYVITLPDPEFPPLARYGAFVYPAIEGKPVYYTRELSFFERGDSGSLNPVGVFGAWGPGVHYNFGEFGPPGSAEEFAARVQTFLTSGSMDDVADATYVTPQGETAEVEAPVE